MNTAVADIELYRILQTRFSDAEAETIIANFDQKVHNKFEERKNEFATKEDLYNLRTELKSDIKNLEVKIAKTHADLVKWMFIFWIGQLASFIAIAKFLFHQ